MEKLSKLESEVNGVGSDRKLILYLFSKFYVENYMYPLTAVLKQKLSLSKTTYINTCFTKF